MQSKYIYVLYITMMNKDIKKLTFSFISYKISIIILHIYVYSNILYNILYSIDQHILKLIM